MSTPRTLRFGIQSLDKLIGVVKQDGEDLCGIHLTQSEPTDPPVTSSVCLTGPDGTGKSVFSLHIASRYLADCITLSMPSDHSSSKVLYISTDLSYEMALKAWKNFSLDIPSRRREPLMELKAGRKNKDGPEIKLNQYFPAGNDTSSKHIINYLERSPSQSEVCFVDLASRTAGDDWGFVHRLMSTLEAPGEHQPRHLVVLDAVEGFETLVGDLNAFGEKSSRRSRIAQVMRLAAGKCHLVFVVEEAREERFPEEFVTDVVIRLRNVERGRYLRRTVEIEKARGQSHARGQHPFVIRDGQGSTTGRQMNADEPAVLKYGFKDQYQSYVHVFSSLHYLSRERMIDKFNPREHDPDKRFAGFGLEYLDNMLRKAELKPQDDSDLQGLPCGYATALIGDVLTQKTQLGRAFLSRAFYPYAKRLALSEPIPTPAADQPVTVMFTTRVEDNDELADRFYEWLEGTEDIKTLFANEEAKNDLKEYIRQHTICRRFEIHDISAPVLLHIFQRNIEMAQRIMLNLKEEEELPKQEELFQKSWRIRVVIDDLNAFRDTFPEMRDDPLMLPALLSMLRKEGVTTLIVDTQTSGSPDLPITERFDSSVRELVQHRIYTWRLPFYGENRVGISIIPPISQEYLGIIRELRWETKDESNTEKKTDRSLTVDPHFELYAGLEKGLPQPVPLEVRLYAETPNFKKYIETEERFFREVFMPVATPGRQEKPRVIASADTSEYDALRDSCHLQRDTRMDHTTILQVDEFWWLRRARQNRVGAFRQQWSYLEAVTATNHDEGFRPDFVVDPFEIFQPPPLPKSVGMPPELPNEPPQEPQSKKRRADFFDTDCGYNLHEIGDQGDSPAWVRNIDRVPFTWDFGFLLCNGNAWEEASPLEMSKNIWLFRVDDFLEPDNLLNKLSINQGVAAYLWKCSQAIPTLLNSRGKMSLTDFLGTLAKLFNILLKGPSLYDEKAFEGVALSAETKELVAKSLIARNATVLPRADESPTATATSIRLNRLLLQDTYPGEIAKRKGTVGDVWTKLRKADHQSVMGTSRISEEPVTWREFLNASKVVAEFHSYRTSTPATTFDLTMLMPESFSCLILEMWLSEAHCSLSKHEKKHKANEKLRVNLSEKRNYFVRRVRQRRWSWDEDLRPRNLLRVLQQERGRTLEELLKDRTNETQVDPVKGYSLELYKVWLLLLEALSFPKLVDSSTPLNFEFKSGHASPQAVSARHWYKTASTFMESLTPEQLEYNWIPIRLPGHFSVRADWFLAVAAGSRSNRLADHALDLLSSQRANVTRLQEGLGLPTRILFSAENRKASRLRTRLMCSPKKGEPLASVEYETLRNIAASNSEKLQNEEEFYWLWRSGIWAYNRHSRVWQKWLNRTLIWWNSLRKRYGSNWTSSFELYDLLNDIEFSSNPDVVKERWGDLQRLDLTSWKEFSDLRDILIAELEQVSISAEGGASENQQGSREVL